MKPIRILIVDDHTLLRSGIKLALQRHEGFEGVGEAGEGLEGIKRAKQLKPDVVLLDLHMQIEQHHVWLELFCALDAFQPLAGLAHPLESFVPLQSQLDTAAEQRVIVNDQNAYRFHTSEFLLCGRTRRTRVPCPGSDS